MSNAAIMCMHRTIGTERQIVIVTVENASDYPPDGQYGRCRNSAYSLDSVVGTSTTELFTLDNFTVGDATSTLKPHTSYVDIVCTFKTPNAPIYVTITLEKQTPRIGNDPYANIPVVINQAVASVAGTLSYSQWTLVSCNLRFYRNAYVE